MRALVTAVIYFGSFLMIGLIAKLAIGRWFDRRIARADTALTAWSNVGTEPLRPVEKLRPANWQLMSRALDGRSKAFSSCGVAPLTPRTTPCVSHERMLP